MRKAITRLLASTSSRHSPKQIAAAVAMGVLCGCIPCLSPLWCALLLVAVCMPIHLSLYLLVTLAVGALASHMPSAIGEVGVRSLTHPYLSGMWLQLDSYPLIPWLGLHNTLVNGGVLCGAALWMPVYLAVRSLATNILIGDSARPVEQQPELGVPEPQWIDAPVILDAEAIQPVSRASTTDAPEADLERILEECRANNYSLSPSADAQHIMHRAAKVAALVDDLLATLDELSLAEVGSAPHASHEPLQTSVTQLICNPPSQPDILDQPRVLKRGHTPASPSADHPACLPNESSVEVSGESSAARAEGEKRLTATPDQTLTPTQTFNTSTHQCMAEDEALPTSPTDRPRPTLEEAMLKSRHAQSPMSTAQDDSILAQHEAHREQSTSLLQNTAPVKAEKRTAPAKERLGMHRAEHQEEALRYLLNHLRQLSEKA